MANVAKYGKPQELEKKIDEYFAKYENRQPLTDKNGLPIVGKDGRILYSEGLPTSSGLAYFLGFNSRSSLWDYAQKPTFADVINKARLRLQTFWEPLLSSSNFQGARYMLSNLADNWQDPDSIAKQQSQALPIVANIVFIDKDGKTTQAKTIDAEVLNPCEPPLLPSKTKALTQEHKPKTRSTKASKTKAKARAKK